MTTLPSAEFGLFLGGLAGLFLGVAATSLGQRRLRLLPWPCLAAFGCGIGAALWMTLWTHFRGPAFGLDWLQVALTAAALAALCEFGRRGLPPVRSRIAAPILYAPAVLLIAAASWAAVTTGEIAGLRAVCRYTLALPGGVLAGFALWRAAGTSIVDKNRPLRWAAAALAAWSLAFGLVVPAADFFPAAWLNEDSFLATARLPVELLCACGLLTALAGVWWHQRGSAWAVHRPGPLGRWLLPTAFAALAVLGGAATARLTQDLDADQCAIAVAGSVPGGDAALKQAVPADEAKDWSKMSAQRLHAGLPVVIIALLVLGGMAVVAVKLAPRCP